MNMCEHEKDASILVVDDNPDNLRLLAELLNEHHYKVRLARKGSRALATIRKEAPDLLLLDVMMPEMDGFEVCRQLKADEETADIPIIFISALHETIDKVKAFTLGGVDYVTKPFQPEELLARVNTHIRLKRTLTALEDALREIKTLRGLIPICASCKKIRDDNGYWNHIESYISAHSEAEFTHGYCPSCIEKLYGHLRKKKQNK